MNVNRSQSVVPFINRIVVEKLFGLYSYDLSARDINESGAAPRVLLLYGDNGTGKTTLAQMVFHLLSLAHRRGHRDYLAGVKFKNFVVEFQDGASIGAYREGTDLDGAYEIISKKADGKWAQVSVGVSEEGRVSSKQVDERALNQVLQFYSESLFVTYFLSDNRILQSDCISIGDDDVQLVNSTMRGRRHSSFASRTQSLFVGPSIGRAVGWLQSQALAASRVSEQNISTLYIDILQRIANAEAADRQPSQVQLPDLRAELYRLAARSEQYSEFGMIPRIPLIPLLDALDEAPPLRAALLANVLEPYVNSIRTRLDAMQGIQRKLSAFVEIINAFYRKKRVIFRISDGIAIENSNGEYLDPELLSSGEKQLMLLLCNVLVASEKPALFIIDEPELSLNVKWQRLLVDSLLELVEGTNVQFLMATHSIELLTRHRKCVLHLRDMNEPNEGAK